MNVIDIIIEFSESLENKTIFDVLDDCIESAKNFEKAAINVNWFIELKWKIEEELKTYAFDHCVPVMWLMNNNRVEMMNNGLKITNETKDFTYLELHFPSEFNPNSIIMKRSFY